MSSERASGPPPPEVVGWIGVAAGRRAPVPEPENVAGEAASGWEEAVSGFEAASERGERAAGVSALIFLGQWSVLVPSFEPHLLFGMRKGTRRTNLVPAAGPGFASVFLSTDMLIAW